MVSLKLTVGAALAGTALATYYPPILDPAPYTTWTGSYNGSKVAEVSVPFTNIDGEADSQDYARLDLVGDAAARGFAHGYLMHKDIEELTVHALPKFYRMQVQDLFDGLPSPIGKGLARAAVELGLELKAPGAFDKALSAVFAKQEKYISQANMDELHGIADGMCAAKTLADASQECDSDDWFDKIARFNMIPELVRMSCTVIGGWGPATQNGALFQVRALDFGASPLATFTTLAVHRDASGAPLFASVSFPGFVGVVTALSPKIGLSEKVWETYEGTGLQPGSYDGEAVVMVMRDAVENAASREDAESMFDSAQRTWAVWLGVGGAEDQILDVVQYKQDSTTVQTDQTLPDVTLQPKMDSLAYVDKHPQPSKSTPDSDDYLPNLLQARYGNLTAEAMVEVVAGHETGDIQVAFYDWTPDKERLLFSIGKVDAKTTFGPENHGKGCYRAFSEFSLTDLWAGN